MDVVDRAVAEGLVQRVPVTAAEVPGFTTCLTESGDLLTLPGPQAEHDAFFMSRLSPVAGKSA
jgi:16S rRNA (cytosine967-C5)-methyltransferase